MPESIWEHPFFRKKIPTLFDGDKVVGETLHLGGELGDKIVTCVSMGNPHCITYVDDVKNA